MGARCKKCPPRSSKPRTAAPGFWGAAPRPRCHPPRAPNRWGPLGRRSPDTVALLPHRYRVDRPGGFHQWRETHNFCFVDWKMRTLEVFPRSYPLVISDVTIEMSSYSWFTHSELWFSVALLVYQTANISGKICDETHGDLSFYMFHVLIDDLSILPHKVQMGYLMRLFMAFAHQRFRWN